MPWYSSPRALWDAQAMAYIHGSVCISFKNIFHELQPWKAVAGSNHVDSALCGCYVLCTVCWWMCGMTYNSILPIMWLTSVNITWWHHVLMPTDITLCDGLWRTFLLYSCLALLDVFFIVLNEMLCWVIVNVSHFVLFFVVRLITGNCCAQVIF